MQRDASPRPAFAECARRPSGRPHVERAYSFPYTYSKSYAELVADPPLSVANKHRDSGPRQISYSTPRSRHHRRVCSLGIRKPWLNAVSNRDSSVLLVVSQAPDLP
jgi:hypothetical protein